MSRCSPFVVVLSDADRVVLEQRVRGYTTPFAVVVRARIVLLAAQGMTNVGIAQRLGVDADTVSKWRKRFVVEGLGGLKDRQRSGRPRTFAAEVVAGVKAMACQPPGARAVPLSRWSSAELAAQAVAEGLTVSVSASTVRRWLADDAIKPWQHRSWIFPRDPQFAAKAARVLDLYQRMWDGVALGEDEYVISADEKSQLQALARCHPELAPAPGRSRRVEFEYDRGGALAYFGAYDVAKPPESTKTSLQQRLAQRARSRWPALASVEVRFRAQFAYIDGHLPDGEVLPLCRLRYGGSASTWGFAIYLASKDGYEDSILPNGQLAGSPEDALDCACGLYLNDPTAWQTDRSPTN